MFIVADEDGKDVLSPCITQLTSQNFDCFIDGGDFVLSHSRDYQNMSHSNKYRSYYSLYQMQKNCFSGAGYGRDSVGTITTKFSKKLILSETGMMWCFGHLIIIAHNPPWCHHSVSIIQLVMLLVLHLVLQLVMVKLLWVLGPPT